MTNHPTVFRSGRAIVREGAHTYEGEATYDGRAVSIVGHERPGGRPVDLLIPINRLGRVEWLPSEGGRDV